MARREYYTVPVADLATGTVSVRMSVAVAGAVVGEGVAGRRDEVPDVAVRSQRQLQDTIRVGDRFRIRRDGGRHARRIATGPRIERAKTARRVQIGARVLWRKALVVVLLAVQDNLCVRVIQINPEWQHARRAVPCRIVGREEGRVLEHGDGARLRVRREI